MTRKLLMFSLLLVLARCGPSYSPDTYSSAAVQQANKVDRGIVVGVRDVSVSAAGTAGAVVGGAAGGIAGSQVGGTGVTSALTALGGSLVGGLVGSGVEHATADTAAYEYVVRKPNGDLISVTQKDATPLAIGQHVLVIAGNQARIVPDYTVISDEPTQPPTKDKAAGEKAATDKAAGDKTAPDKTQADIPAADKAPADKTDVTATPLAPPAATATNPLPSRLPDLPPTVTPGVP